MASEQMLGPSGRSRHRDNAEVLEIGGQANVKEEQGLGEDAGARPNCKITAPSKPHGGRHVQEQGWRGLVGPNTRASRD